ncbi:hypothetical protein BC939DRAFT_451416 [Gamsiella multidivaricata]|uniref:uncharacterized protein n=1 Tax=Gamsiella multidivaricata TaxID=101098 RepID=UPI0022208154|nr:uncharacterized protein BC939DRAFT_451416 [Gamsiella multidivaricata]KAI7823581.1 hypothetical protein BC939DRAFT_451416 [Gamsiella multidivaricata]
MQARWSCCQRWWSKDQLKIVHVCIRKGDRSSYQGAQASLFFVCLGSRCSRAHDRKK